MDISFDPVKRAQALEKRGLDFADAGKIFESDYLTWEDDREDYGETRYNSFGFLDDRAVLLTWTPRDGHIRVISMRKANEREQIRFGRILDRSG